MVTDFAADWFHPNDRGHRVWAQAFWTVLEPRLPTPVGTPRRSSHSAGRPTMTPPDNRFDLQGEHR